MHKIMHKLARIIAAVFAFAICAPSLAADKTWQGGGTQDANNRYLVSYGDNWSGGVAPAANDKLIFGATGAGSVSFDAGLNYANIYFNGGTYDGYNCVTGSEIWVCQAASTTATLRKQDGDWATTYDVRVGEGDGSLGTFQHSGGTLNIGRTLFVGSANYASAKNNSATIDGGTVYVNGTASGNYRAVALGFKNKSTGTAYLTVSGTGRLVVTEANNIWIGRGGAGHMTIADDAVVDVSNGLVAFFGGELARDEIGNAKNANCVSFLYLNGGTLLTQCIKYGASDPINNRLRVGMYFTGGTLKATADSDSFIKIPYGNVRVQANGGTIDTNGHTINVQEKLDPPNSGTSGDLVITGGGTYTQTGATAYNGRTIVDGNTKYIKNNASSNLKLVVKAGSSFQNAATLASRVAGESLTFEDGAKLVVEPKANQIAVSAPAIDVQGALTVSLSPAPPLGTYTLMQITGSGTFAADVLSRITFENATADFAVSLSADGKTIYCVSRNPPVWIGGASGSLSVGANWSSGVVPSGCACIIANATAANLETGDSFAPTAITFPADTAAVTISGPGAISGVSAITNNTSLHHVFNCQVVCPDGVTPNITRTSAGYMTFAGGLSMHNAPKTGGGVSDFWSGKISITTTGEQKYYMNGNRGWILPSSTFSFNNGYLDGMYIDSGATVAVERLVYDGCLRSATANSKTSYFSAVFDNGNGVIRVGEIRAQGDAVLFHSYAGSDMTGGTIIADKLTCAQNKQTGGAFPYPIFMLNCGAVSGSGLHGGDWNGEGVWAIGPGGLSFAESVHSRTHYELKLGKSIGGRPAATLHSFADWTLHANPNGGCALALQSDNGTFLVIDTSHYTIGEPEYDSATSHDVTLTGTIDGGGAMRVVGNGRVIFNSASSFTGGLTVSNAATVAVNAGCKPGNGAVLVTGGATFALPQTGTVTIPGAVTLQKDSMLEFKANGADNALVTFSSAPSLPDNGTVKVKLTADSNPVVAQSYTLTSGAGLSNADKFELADGVRGTLTVVSNELVYTAPNYFYIKVR